MTNPTLPASSAGFGAGSLGLSPCGVSNRRYPQGNAERKERPESSCSSERQRVRLGDFTVRRWVSAARTETLSFCFFWAKPKEGPAQRKQNHPNLLSPLLRLAAALLLLSACENPIAYQTDHLEAIEVVIRDPETGAELARTDENRVWTGPLAEQGLVLEAGESRELQVTFVTLEGREVGLRAFAGLSLRADWAPEGLALHEPLTGVDVVHALRPGQTKLRLMAWHGDHADLITPPLPVIITP